jgi:hypothetical protein
LKETSDCVFDPRERCTCKVDFISRPNPLLSTSTGLAFVGLEATLSFLRPSEQELLDDEKGRAPQAVLSLTIRTEIAPIFSSEKPDASERCGPEVTPRTKELCRFLERRRAAEFGHELPLYASEAADYIGVSRAALDHFVSKGEILCHIGSGENDEPLFYASELNEWLGRHSDPSARDLAFAPRMTRGTEHE